MGILLGAQNSLYIYEANAFLQVEEMVFVICPMPEDSKQAAQVINFMVSCRNQQLPWGVCSQLPKEGMTHQHYLISFS